MKHHLIANILTLSVIFVCGTAPAAFAANNIISASDTAGAQPAIAPQRSLTYGTIQSLSFDGETVDSLLISDQYDNNILCLVSDSTAFLDSGRGIRLSSSDLQAGDAVYIYHHAATTASLPPQVAAEAIVTNIPMDVSCAHLHTVTDISATKTGYCITTDNGSLNISIPIDAAVTTYIDNSSFSLSDLQSGDRFFTWYETVAESDPAQTFAKHLVVLPSHTETTASPVRISYSADSLPTIGSISYVPLRETADALGLHLSWDRDTRTATLTSDARTMDLTEGMDLYASITTIPHAVGMTAPISFGAAPYIDSQGTMYVPADAFGVLVGYTVTTDDHSLTITAQG